MQSWAPLWSGLVDSSIWEEPDHVFRVFMAMISLKDCNHVVSMDGYKLARRIHMDPGVVVDALAVLSKPDQRRPDQEFEGRRIQQVEDGWLVLQGEYYRKLVSQELRRSNNRRSQKAFRERKNKDKPMAGETAYEKALERGDDKAAEAVLRGLEREKTPESSPEQSGGNGLAGADGNGPSTEIPEIPLSGDSRVMPGGGDMTGKWDFQQPHPTKQNFMEETKPKPSEFEQIARDQPEAEPESGRFVDGVWVPD